MGFLVERVAQQSSADWAMWVCLDIFLRDMPASTAPQTIFLVPGNKHLICYVIRKQILLLSGKPGERHRSGTQKCCGGIEERAE